VFNSDRNGPDFSSYYRVLQLIARLQKAKF
jgi:hypothetical protein